MIGPCASCGKDRKLHALELCAVCYNRSRRQGSVGSLTDGAGPDLGGIERLYRSLAPAHPAEEDPSWRRDATCAGMDPDIFYPETTAEAARARAICDACPVQEPCLEYALARREQHGMWGGTTRTQRRRILRERGKVAS